MLLIPLYCLRCRFLFLLFSGFLVTCYAEASDTENYYALLVGVAKYSSLTEDQQLIGPENDVRLLKKIFINHYQFTEHNITTLSTAEDVKLKPTYRLILTELQKLVDKVKANDNVVLYFSGHGSQQPNPKEIDGFDEIFLPSDIEQWNDEKKAVKNALVDNEIGHYIDKLLAKKAFVWLIMDSCHSATSAREGTTTIENVNYKIRGIALQDLGMPRFSQSRGYSENNPIQPSTFLSKQEKQLPPSSQLIVFSASAANESASEQEHFSFTDKNKRKVYGDFTYVFATVLLQKEALKHRLSYRELQESIRQEFSNLGINRQNPQYEGEKDLTIFSNTPKKQINKWEIKIKRNKNRVKRHYYIDAGKIQGLAKGMHLNILPTVNEKNTDIIATVKIIKINRGESELCIVDKSDNCIMDETNTSRLEKILHRYKIVFAHLSLGEVIPTLKVYISGNFQQGKEQLIKEKLTELQQKNTVESRFIDWVTEEKTAEVIVNFPSEQTPFYKDKSTEETVWLQVPQNSTKRFKVNIPINDHYIFKDFIDKLSIINKTLRLKELAQYNNDPLLEKNIIIALFKKKSDELTWQALNPKQSSVTITPGHDIGFTLKNNNPVKDNDSETNLVKNEYIDIGFFLLSPNYKIIPFLCYDADSADKLRFDGKSMRLAPQEVCNVNEIDANYFIKISNKKSALGRYYLLILATTKSLKDLPEDYAYLSQPVGLTRRGREAIKDNNKIARYLDYFFLQGGNRFSRGEKSTKLLGDTHVFLRLIELNVQ